MPPALVLYDGVCGLCNRFVQFILRRDHAEFFRFASLQSPLAARILERQGGTARGFETMCVVTSFDPAQKESRELLPEEHLLLRAEAAEFVLSHLSSPYPFFARVLHLLPRPISDWGYGLVARHRHKIFGRYESCPLPDPETRTRFLDL